MSKQITDWFQFALEITGQGRTTSLGNELRPGDDLREEERGSGLLADESVESADYKDEYLADDSDWDNLLQEDTFVPLNHRETTD